MVPGNIIGGWLLLLMLALGACSTSPAEGEESSNGPQPPSLVPSVPSNIDSGPGLLGYSAVCEVDEDCPLAEQSCVDGACSAECERDADCRSDLPCLEMRCEVGRCAGMPIAPELEDDVEGDCRRPVCDEGELTWEEDLEDLPASSGLASCEIPTCDGGRPAYRADDALCAGLGPEGQDKICVAGQGCVLREGPAEDLCPPVPETWAEEEICGNGLDNNGDGIPDSGCPCVFGTVQPCFAGPPAARGVGQCSDGWQVCIDREAPRWGPCKGGVLPAEERCDGQDNACNGCADDGVPECRGQLRCPDTDVVEPLRWYDLDAEALFDGTMVRVQWDVIAPPNSGTTRVEERRASQTRFRVDVSGDYLVRLRIEDDKNNDWECSWIVRAQGAGLRVELRWDTFGDVDLDLHLHRSETETGFCSQDDCYYLNCGLFSQERVDWEEYPGTPDGNCDSRWGEACPNPRLDLDNRRSFAPENINIDNPRDGDRFRLMVHKFGRRRGSEGLETRPVVSVWCGGVLRGALGYAPDEAVLVHAEPRCMGDSWRVADVTMHVDPDTGEVDCTVIPLLGSDGELDIRRGDASY